MVLTDRAGPYESDKPIKKGEKLDNLCDKRNNASTSARNGLLTGFKEHKICFTSNSGKAVLPCPLRWISANPELPLSKGMVTELVLNLIKIAFTSESKTVSASVCYD